MADNPTASDTLGIIGVELWRNVKQGGASSISMVFAVVQTDYKWVAWYVFVDDNNTDVLMFGEAGTGAAEIYGRGFGRTHHEFHRRFVHLTKAMRVDGLAGDNPPKSPALIYTRNTSKIDYVLVDIDIQRTDGFLQLRSLPLEGNIRQEFNNKSTRGEVFRWGDAKMFDKKELKNPPFGSS